MTAKKTVGILGGMGPEATSLLFELLIQATPAQNDQEHLPVCIYNLPQIPDRSAAIRGDGPSPVPMIEHGLRVLENTPADFVLIPCNTVFHFYEAFAATTRLPIVHLIHAVAFALQNKLRHDERKVGILATTGTRISGVYDRVLDEYGFQVLYPSAAAQAAMMTEIYRIKAGDKPYEAAQRAGDELRARGANNIILGCTEISLVYSRLAAYFPVTDALRVLADAGVDIALGQKNISAFCR